jgi:hypothetical protein
MPNLKKQSSLFLPVIIHIHPTSRSLLIQTSPQSAHILELPYWHDPCTYCLARNDNVPRKDGQNDMLWTILMVLLVLWLLGLIGGIGGNLVHLILLVALVVLVIQLITGRRAVI